MNKWIFIGILLTALLLTAKYYYDSSQKKISNLLQENSTLIEVNSKLLAVNQSNLDVIKKQKEDAEKNRLLFSEVEAAFQRTRQSTNDSKLSIASANLDGVALKRPDLAEKAINNATAKVLRCFELLSGSPLTKQELVAKTAQEFNSECPDLFGDIK